jgi:hypothetical protein
LVPPEERAAAAGVTNVPRSLAAALPPLLVGLWLERTSDGWPLVVGGGLKALYDVLLYVRFRRVRPPSEPAASVSPPTPGVSSEAPADADRGQDPERA